MDDSIIWQILPLFLWKSSGHSEVVREEAANYILASIISLRKLYFLKKIKSNIWTKKKLHKLKTNKLNLF